MVKWHNVPGCYSREFKIEDGRLIDVEDGLSPAVLDYWFYRQDILTDGFELQIHFKSSGEHIEMSMYGGPDHVGWPEEHDEERLLTKAVVRVDSGKEYVLPPTVAQAMFDEYEDLIDKVELKED